MHVETPDIRPPAVGMRGVLAFFDGELGERTIDRMLAQGEFPAPVRVGRKRLWLLGDLELYLACGASMEVFRARKAANERAKR